MIIAVSDVHLGYEKSQADEFENFIDHFSSELKSDDDFVLIGDIFEFWRRSNVELLLEYNDLITKIMNMECKVHFCIGNHDYLLAQIMERLPEYYTFNLQKCIRLKKEETISFLHMVMN